MWNRGQIDKSIGGASGTLVRRYFRLFDSATPPMHKEHKTKEASMYKEHPVFKSPTDENATVWRYLDLAKLVSMLHTQSLHFSTVDQLRKSDKFEGALPKPFVEMYKRARKEFKENNPEEWAVREELGQTRDSATSFYKEALLETAVNCWHLNEHESMGMWSQYVKSGEGVAIRSTCKRLINAFDDSRDMFIFVGTVNYIDYDNEMFESMSNALVPVVHKRASFRHENELRAVAMGAGGDGDKMHLDLRRFPEAGIDIPVDLKCLVESVYVAPGMPNWFRETIESVIGKYDLRVPVNQSSLDDEPLW